MAIIVRSVAQLNSAIKKRVKKFVPYGEKKLTIGFHETGAIKRIRHKKNSKPMSVVAAQNHFGVPNDNIPARPFLDVGFKKGIKDYIKLMHIQIKLGLPITDTIDDIGNHAVTNIQLYIMNLKEPRNAPSTIKKKGYNNPLVETRQMMEAVNFKRFGKRK